MSRVFRLHSLLRPKALQHKHLQPSRTKMTGELSQNTIDVLKATAPVVAQHQALISDRFYNILMTDYPVVKNYFNMSHFLDVDGKGAPQARALGNAVVAYAENCDNLGALASKIYS